MWRDVGYMFNFTLKILLLKLIIKGKTKWMTKTVGLGVTAGRDKDEMKITAKNSLKAPSSSL